MQQTQQGQIKGKIAYMSPEQARGKGVDRRSDVFAAGIVLWELFTGKRLFEGENEATVLTQLLTETPPLLSTVDASLEPYDAILKRALTTSPDERFPSALEMATTLGDAVAVAPRSEVARWVRTEARVMLAKRAALIAKHVAFASRSELDDTPRSELDEPSSDIGSDAAVGATDESRVDHPGRASHEPSLPDSAFRTQKLTPEMLAEFRSPGPPGNGFDGDSAFLRTGGASGRPSDAPPAQSRVTALSLASADLPPPLPEERVRQLFWVGIITAGSVALVVGALLVIVSKRPWSAAATSHRVVPASVDLLGRAAAVHRLSPPSATTSDPALSSPSPPASATASPSASVSAAPSPSPKPSSPPPSSGTSTNGKPSSSKGPSTPSKPVSSATPKSTPPTKSPSKGR